MYASFFNEILNDDSIKIVVEVMGGINPAKDYILKAMSKKKNIVTANKMLIATNGDELFHKADEEGHRADEQRGQQGLQRVVMGDGEAHRQGINGSGHTLHQKGGQPDLPFLTVTVLVFDSVQQHFSTDKQQQDQCNPGDQLFKGPEILDDGVHANPSDHGHQCLKERKNACLAAHSLSLHAGLIQPVGHGYGKGIHGQSHTQQCAVHEK